MTAADGMAASADVTLFNVESSTAHGMRLTLKLCNLSDLSAFEQITRFKDGHAGGIYTAVLLGDDWSWNGEVMFQGWSASHTGGVKIRFLLNDEADFTALSAIPRGAKAAIGMREFVDGVLVDETQREKVATERGGALSKRAARLCRDPEFLEWLAISHGRLDEAAAAEWMRNTCHVASRAQLDHDPRAADVFHTVILSPFTRWSSPVNT